MTSCNKLFSFFTVKEKLDPVRSTVPASKQVQGSKLRNCIKGQGRLKREGDFLGEKKVKFQLVTQTFKLERGYNKKIKVVHYCMEAN